MTRVNAAECEKCIQRWAKKAAPPPCKHAYKAGLSNGNPQAYMYLAGEIGNGCPATKPWSHVWPRIKPGQGYDTNQWTRSNLSAIVSLIMNPVLYKIPPDQRGNEDTGERAGYVYDSASERYGHKTVNGEFRPLVFFDPGNRQHVKFMRDDVIGKIVADERSTWFGFVTRFASGVGTDEERSAGSEYAIGAIYNWHQFAQRSCESHSFQAQLERVSTTGADATSGFNFVVITGMSDIGLLKGTKFSGTDVNIAFIVSAKAVKELAKAPKYIMIAEKMLKGAERLKQWEKTELLALVQRVGGFGSAYCNRKGIEVSFVDIGLTMGAAASVTNWKGTITSVDHS